MEATRTDGTRKQPTEADYEVTVRLKLKVRAISEPVAQRVVELALAPQRKLLAISERQASELRTNEAVRGRLHRPFVVVDREFEAPTWTMPTLPPGWSIEVSGKHDGVTATVYYGRDQIETFRGHGRDPLQQAAAYVEVAAQVQL